MAPLQPNICKRDLPSFGGYNLWCGAKMTLNDEWITVSEAAKLSGYNEDHLRELIRDTKAITGRKFSIVWMVNRKSLLAYLAKQSKLGRKRGPKKKSSS
jgi:hypothetical protein